jgi:hypothetical protein
MDDNVKGGGRRTQQEAEGGKPSVSSSPSTWLIPMDTIWYRLLLHQIYQIYENFASLSRYNSYYSLTFAIRESWRYTGLFIMFNSTREKNKVHCRTMNLTLMKTFRPAMLYRPSPTFFTFILLHLVEGHWQWRWATLVTCWTYVTKREKVKYSVRYQRSPWYVHVLQVTK